VLSFIFRHLEDTFPDGQQNSVTFLDQINSRTFQVSGNAALAILATLTICYRNTLAEILKNTATVQFIGISIKLLSPDVAYSEPYN